MQRIRYNEKGAILVLGAIIIIPMLLLVGLAIDGSLGFLNQRKLQAAVNSAARAGVLMQTQSDITSEVQKIFQSNIGGLPNVTGPTTTVNFSQNTVTVSASTAVPTTFMALGGIRSVTYTAKTTLRFPPYMEVAIVVDASVNSACNKSGWWWHWWGNWQGWWGWNSGWGGCGQGCGQWSIPRGDSYLKDLCDALVSFVNNLPTRTLVSIVPFSTEVAFDSSTTVLDNFVSHFSPTSTDETASPALFAIDRNHYSFNASSVSSVGNYFYGDSFSTKTSYYPLPGTCPNGYPSCPTLYPGNCAQNKKSCTSQYTYDVSPMIPILPLTANRSLITTYLSTLGNFTGGSDGAWLSLGVWGWRTLDPGWGDFFKTNANSQNTTRATGVYPSAYGTVPKTVIFLLSGATYWNHDTGCYYTNHCGDSAQQRQYGWWWYRPVYFPMQTWKVTAYGVVPMTDACLDDGTCDNYDFQTLDDSLGLNLSTKSYLANVNYCTYRSSILTALDQKTQNIINNMKAQGIKVFVVVLSPCQRWHYNWDPCHYYQSCKQIESRLRDYASNEDYFYQTNGNDNNIASVFSSIGTQLQQISAGSS